MKEIEDGGPAFPETRWDENTRQEVQWTGMTMRDYFAAKAMSHWLSLPIELPMLDRAAKAAYQVADAMLKAREES